MKATFATLFATAVTLTALVGSAAADPYHAQLRRFDDLTFAAIGDARALRWEIHDDFVGSRDYQHLLEEVDELMSNLRDVQQAIYAERAPAALDRILDRSLNRLNILRQDLLNCDFARSIPGYHFSNGRGGYHFSGGSVHPGRVHFEAAMQLVDRVSLSLNTLHQELVGPPVPVHGHVGNPFPYAAPQAVDPPSLPALPVKNQGWNIPVVKGKNGNIVFKFGN